MLTTEREWDASKISEVALLAAGVFNGVLELHHKPIFNGIMPAKVLAAYSSQSGRYRLENPGRMNLNFGLKEYENKVTLEPEMRPAVWVAISTIYDRRNRRMLDSEWNTFILGGLVLEAEKMGALYSLIVPPAEQRTGMLSIGNQQYSYHLDVYFSDYYLKKAV